jgi:hypothetical protein
MHSNGFNVRGKCGVMEAGIDLMNCIPTHPREAPSLNFSCIYIDDRQ